MRLKDLHLKLKGWRRLRGFLLGAGGGNKEREKENGKRPSWTMPISRGYHVVEGRSFGIGLKASDSDSVAVQREQIEEHELWFFGVFDSPVGDGITKYIQSDFFNKRPKKSQMRRESKETMRKAYLNAREKIRETEKPGETRKVGSASAIVVNGEQLVMANMGDYGAVVCRDGEAKQVNRKHQDTTRRRWIRRLISGAIRIPKVRILLCDSSHPVGNKAFKSSEPVVGSRRIDSNTEFIILASTGIWEVMKHQEAVNLIGHIEDPQEAAECLAKEALTRRSRSHISCLIIRFD